MKIYTSYFYQIRFFPVNLIPLSTAKFDPKWYYDNKHQGYQWYDKRGILVGMRAEPFVPGNHLNGLCFGAEHCSKDFSQCNFLKGYLNQLRLLDFDKIMLRFQMLQKQIGIDCDFALIVHEAPNNPCSERVCIQEWFKENNLEVKEWKHDTNKS